MTTTSAAPIRVADCGDAALRVTSTSPDRETACETVQVLSELLESQPSATGITGTIATYDAVLVEFDPLVTGHDDVRDLVRATNSGLTDAALARPARPRQLFRIPVVYGGEHGPDLERVAEQQGITPAEVIALHTATPLLMRCFGSPGGAPMLDGPAFPAPVPRLSSPRPHVPAGAVAVAGRQAVVSALLPVVGAYLDALPACSWTLSESRSRTSDRATRSSSSPSMPPSGPRTNDD